MKLGICTSKLCIAFIALIFWGAAAALIYLGVWIQQEYSNYVNIVEEVYTTVPAAILMAGGVFLFLLGIVGCIGACKEQKCILGLFFSILLVIFVAMAASFVLAWVYRDRVNTAFNDGMNTALQNYYDTNSTKNTSNVFKDEVDYMQQTLECCGVNSYTDWLNTSWYTHQQKQHVIHPYPESCCANKNCTYGIEPVSNGTVFQSGCLTKLKTEFRGHLGIIIGVAVAFAVLLVIGMIVSCVLICKRREGVPYMGLDDPSGMRV